MTVPLILLAIPTLFLGLVVGWPLESGLIHQWLAPVFHEAIEIAGHAEGAFELLGIDGALVILSVAVAALGIAGAWALFGVEFAGIRRASNPERVRALSARVPFLYRASLNKWWFDDLYDLLFIRIGGRVAAALWWFDRVVIDGTVNGIGALTSDAGRGLRRVQTGHVQNYALGIAIGLIVMAGGYLVIAGR
jgi:NADH-quinone oxidoreductase subunit L